MGDKSPKSKHKNQQQATQKRADEKAAHDEKMTRDAPATPGKGKGKG